MAAVNFRNFAVSGVLHGVALLPAQQLDQQRIQKLRTGADDDLAAVHVHATELAQIVADGPAQLLRPVVGGGL